MDRREYNGNLEALYSDIDKRVAVMENNNKVLGEKRDNEFTEFKAYIHTKFHDMMNVLATIELEIRKLPCEVRKEKQKSIDAQLGWIWKTLSVVVFLIVTLAIETLWKKHM